MFGKDKNLIFLYKHRKNVVNDPLWYEQNDVMSLTNLTTEMKSKEIMLTIGEGGVDLRQE